MSRPARAERADPVAGRITGLHGGLLRRLSHLGLATDAQTLALLDALPVIAAEVRQIEAEHRAALKRAAALAHHAAL